MGSQMKSQLVAAVALATLAAGAAYAAGLSPTMKTVDLDARHFAHAPVNRVLAVLYDQTGDVSGNSTNSQNFEAAENDLDDQAADDFTVPTGKKWLVQEVDVPGIVNGPNPVQTVNVFIYYHAKGAANHILPGNVRKEFDNIPAGDNGTGNLTITLPETVTLRPGTYFVSVQANMDSDTEGRWYWSNADRKEALYRAVWRNPVGGWGNSCPDWHRNDECTGNVDLLFALRGVEN